LPGHQGQGARGVALERGPSGAARAAAARLAWAARVAAAVRVAEAARVAAVQVAVAATAETGNPGDGLKRFHSAPCRVKRHRQARCRFFSGDCAPSIPA
jgi:hypothetical protein